MFLTVFLIIYMLKYIYNSLSLLNLKLRKVTVNNSFLIQLKEYTEKIYWFSSSSNFFYQQVWSQYANFQCGRVTEGDMSSLPHIRGQTGAADQWGREPWPQHTGPQIPCRHCELFMQLSDFIEESFSNDLVTLNGENFNYDLIYNNHKLRCSLEIFYLQDTNPIYLFSKMAIEAATPPSPSVHYGSGKY